MLSNANINIKINNTKFIEYYFYLLPNDTFKILSKESEN
jgi:hypothetical protein